MDTTAHDQRFTPKVVLENLVDLGRSPGEAFVYLSDLRNEIHWNPAMKAVTLLTEGPVGVGSRYQARWAGSGALIVEYVAYDPPHRWITSTRSTNLWVRFEGSLSATDGGSRLAVRMELLPKGKGKLFFPVLRRILARQEQANMAHIKAALG